jgi:hypothetical protein
MARTRAVSAFEINLASVEELMSFDAKLIDVIAVPLRRLKQRLEKHDFDSPRLQPDTILQTLETIRRSSSLAVHYAAMYNQCLVLTASYFSSAVRELFVEAVADATTRRSKSIMNEKLSLSIPELLDVDIERPRMIAEAIADRSEHSWQDMKSIGRAFDEYFGAAPGRDVFVNDIVAALSLRHAIVHAGAILSKRTVGQLSAARPRNLWLDVVRDSPVQVTPDEVRYVGRCMLTYLQSLDEIVEGAASKYCGE